MRVVLFGDSTTLFRSIESALQNELFTWERVRPSDLLTGAVSLEVSPDLAIVDQTALSKEDVRNFKSLQKILPQIPFIVLIDRPGATERVKFLSLGAEDCLTKPIDITELVLRLKRSRKRSSMAADSLITNINLGIDEQRKDFFVGTKPLKLTPHEYLLAENFYYHPGQVFSRSHLLEMVWNRHSEMESNGLEVTISHLRKKLRNAGADVAIQSRRNFGYWLEHRPHPLASI